MEEEKRTLCPITEDEFSHFVARIAMLVGDDSVRSFAHRAKLSPGTMHNILNGGFPRLDSLVAIANAGGVTLEWLATGRGSMTYADDLSVGYSDGYHTKISNDEFSMVSLYDVEASMGHGALNDQEHVINQLAFRNDWLKDEGLDSRNLAAITARGDSMDPTIKSGDTLLIDLSDWLPDDGIYALRMSGKLYVKRIQRISNDLIRVKSDNPLYDDVDLNESSFLGNDEGSEHDIIGKVVWSGRRL